MKQKLIPIYRKVDGNKRESTYFLDNQSRQVFKTENEKNDYKCWILWALILLLLRSIKTFHLSISNPITILIIIFLFVVSGSLAVYKYKTTLKNKREVYVTQDLIEDYIDRGKVTLKSDIRVSIVMFLGFTTFIVLFMISQWLTWLLFALFLFLDLSGLYVIYLLIDLNFIKAGMNKSRDVKIMIIGMNIVI